MWINRGTELINIEIEKAKRITVDGKSIEIYNTLDDNNYSSKVDFRNAGEAQLVFGTITHLLTGTEEEVVTDHADQSINLLYLSYKETNYLLKAGLETVEQVAGKTERQLRDIRGIGRNTVKKIKESLYNLGYTLRK